MIPVNHSSAPAIEPGVRKRLKRLDPDLFLTFTPQSIDPLTGSVVLYRGKPVKAPHFLLWVKHSDGSVHFVNVYAKFGHEEVGKLERDVARIWAPKDIQRNMREARQKRLTKQRELQAQRHKDKLNANKRKLAEITPVALGGEGKTDHRDVKIFGGPGMGNLSKDTSGKYLFPDGKETGWEGLEKD